ncbi:phosphoribosyltransferase domain-containing protein [Methylicorpusculum sp.]|uniref:phosphoribosyltransferase domain-containing protein n=1 Tax=Methylicorpusculum sp. TaxID=2713644 RepID=UPI0027314064|nr:phosphoribosyltransferase domain-containing protein [Methylicorpusculum sp.]MDP2177225.1 phosphoribosyltransferase domain-containing protein [Methylicorpusculum sp.]MDP3531150.1 phosphoribosyltransferase domain-containing protein [Methylicorpusculum sp.]MDZ4151311.1 phosphoribosyltransferase domain-containing protein [Methylicorpusculum sp.]
MNPGSSLTVKLRTGHLRLSTNSGHIPLKRLIGFSSRINSQRGFLFISKVLGKHYPVKPKTMAWTYRALTKRLFEKPEFSGPSLWIGMAETATGLGYGVYESACSFGVVDALFMQTTRYHLSGYKRLEFIEAHSHATEFFLYCPQKESHRHIFYNARQLVLVDDEISTGATFSRLIDAYRRVNPNLEKIIIVSLVNFASPEHRQKVEVSSEISVQWISLLEGRWEFDAVDSDHERNRDDAINVIGNGLCKRTLLAWPGRTGIDRPITFSEASLSCLKQFLQEDPGNRPILVLGTGECNPPAYILGRSLERQGYSVIVQATTRSPINVEGDIGSSIRFTDNYQDGIHNFLYNINPDAYRLIIFCHETPLKPEANADDLDFIGVIRKLNGISAQFSYQDNECAQLDFCRP